MTKYTLSYDRLLDKIYGCWLGKSISGTIGAPYEGYKGLLNVQYDPRMIENMLPNDDLDLQILWLEVVEKLGPGFTSRDLADAFFHLCPYSPGEYATFRKNYALGIYPPLSGKFNNNYYICGMGCPIRSEIWACLAPADPVLAASLSERDGCLDHDGDSIEAERYLAALEALAFVWDGSIRDLIEASLAYVDASTRFAGLVRDVLDWFDAGEGWRQIYGRVLRGYGHPDCTNMYQNLGVTLLSLLCGEGDFMNTTIMALNCGFDTDCTCATVGSILGILRGGAALMEQYHFEEQHFKLGVTAHRRSDKITDLAEDTAAAALLFLSENSALELTDLPASVQTPLNASSRPVSVMALYDNDDPTIDHLDSRTIHLHLLAHKSGRVTFTSDHLSLNPRSLSFDCGNLCVDLTADLPFDSHVLYNQNLIRLHFEFDDGSDDSECIGLAGATLWKVYGPFWRNVTEVAPPAALESYYSGLGGATNQSESFTIIRQFHLNMHDCFDRDIMEGALLRGEALPEAWQNLPETDGFDAVLKTDRFCFEDFMGFAGPCTVYMTRSIWSDEEQTVFMQIGHSDRFRLYLNGELLAGSDITECWTPENLHVVGVKLKKGANSLVLKLNRSTNAASDFSVMFTHGGPCTEMHTDLGSVIE